MELSAKLLSLTAVFYGAAFVFHLRSFAPAQDGKPSPAFALMRIGFLISTFYFMTEAVHAGAFLPVVSLGQATAFCAWSLAFVYLVLFVRIQTESFGLILTPILLTLTATALGLKLAVSAPAAPARPLVLDPYFTAHILSAFFAYASFTISFAAGVLYLIQNHQLKSKTPGNFYYRLPSLEELERLVCRPLFWGAPLLLVAAAVGVVWSKSAFGRYWIFDPKTIATSATAVLYFAILYLHSVSSVRGKQVAVLSLIAFALVIFSFVGTRFLSGSHPGWP